jgi:hypothetical protein
MKGLFAWVGFRQVTLDYDVAPRRAGKSSFNARRLWGLALEGITSFSTVPLTVWVWLGMLIAGLALAYGGVGGAQDPGLRGRMCRVMHRCWRRCCFWAGSS